MDGFQLYRLGRGVMRQDVQIVLREVAYSIVNGYEVGQNTDSPVWAGKRSVTRNEYYQASQAGYRADIVFSVYSFEYSGQSQILLDGVVYDVVRTYQKSLDTLELTCQAREEK